MVMICSSPLRALTHLDDTRARIHVPARVDVMINNGPYSLYVATVSTLAARPKGERGRIVIAENPAAKASCRVAAIAAIAAATGEQLLAQQVSVREARNHRVQLARLPLGGSRAHQGPGSRARCAQRRPTRSSRRHARNARRSAR